MINQWKTTEQAAMARRLVRSIDGGVLATMSQELPGYPFGSVTPYAMTHEGRIAVYVSGIAQHTKNMLGDPKVCLTVAAEAAGGHNRQALGRVTVVGDAHPVDPAEAAAALERYFAFFPESRAYAGTHDFSLFWIEPRRVRHIAGFGQIFWVDPEEWKVPTPTWSAGEAGILEHMNTDHADAVRALARTHGRAGVEPASVALIALDAEGFHLRSDAEVFYVPFPEPCMTSEQVRAAMVRLTREASAAPRQEGGS